MRISDWSSDVCSSDLKSYAEGGGVVIGTADDAIEYIQGLLDQSGGFGTFLFLGHDWASPAATLNSYRIFAEKVMPHFQNQLASQQASHQWAVDNRGKLFGRAGQAILNAITDRKSTRLNSSH